MKWLYSFCLLLLISLAGCTASQVAGKFEANIQVDPTTQNITNMHVVTTKNYGNIHANVTIDPVTHIPVFEINASKVDATSLAAIVAQSNATIAKSVSEGIINGATGAAGAVMGMPVH